MALGKRETGDAAPLVRKPKRKKTSQVTVGGYTAPSVIPGIPHTIEGMPKPATYTKIETPLTRGKGDRQMIMTGYQSESGRGMSGRITRSLSRDKTQAFQQKQEARKRIAPIADPEAGKAERKRRAARRRMRGQLGTILSQRETLG